jgi:flagellar biosynthesis protein FlhG
LLKDFICKTSLQIALFHRITAYLLGAAKQALFQLLPNLKRLHQPLQNADHICQRESVLIGGKISRKYLPKSQFMPNKKEDADNTNTMKEQMANRENGAHCIAVISGKGGVGKTFITANLAASLSAIGRRVLVVDADLGLANLDVVLGIDPLFTIQDVFQGIRSLDDVLLHTAQGFDLLPAGSALPESLEFTSSLVENITSILNSLECRYDIILFDAGTGIGDVVLFFASLAHEILLVATPEPTSIIDVYATIKIISQLHRRNDFLLIVNQANPECSDQIGATVAHHLQNVISTFLSPTRQIPVRLELIGAIPEDPSIPLAIRKRQLLADIYPEAPSTGLMNNFAGFLNTRIV